MAGMVLDGFDSIDSFSLQRVVGVAEKGESANRISRSGRGPAGVLTDLTSIRPTGKPNPSPLHYSETRRSPHHVRKGKHAVSAEKARLIVQLKIIVPVEEAEEPPICLDGERACPPEDCGGRFGSWNTLKIQTISSLKSLFQ